ncbi:MAG: AAA family ATPase [Leptolyngbyaceae cyanobacterium MO_188.B28]|nr:AAA family ATPase [Leptolyngbyaceae cyanobacterium MO_188.B28]
MVDTNSLAFPIALLEQPVPERLVYFQKVTIPHKKLRVALDSLLINIETPIDLSVSFVVGPAGVGKTTLRRRIEKLLLERALSDKTLAVGQLPIASIEAIPAEQGRFIYKDYYLRVLEALHAPLIKEVSQSEEESSTINTTSYFSQGLQSKRSDTLRRILEQVLKRHRLKALMIDEAQHLVLVAGGKQMLQQMDWLKSIANVTETIHVLFGTYDLLNCCSLSGQVSRRSDDIHLERYHHEQSEDVEEFGRIIQTFQEHLPLPGETNLMQYQDYLMDYSIGCVGILSTWLAKALRMALLAEAHKLA